MSVEFQAFTGQKWPILVPSKSFSVYDDSNLRDTPLTNRVTSRLYPLLFKPLFKAQPDFEQELRPWTVEDRKKLGLAAHELTVEEEQPKKRLKLKKKQ